MQNNSSNNSRMKYSSMTRASDFETVPWKIERLKKEDWELGDYVVGKFKNNKATFVNETVETTSGRHALLMDGDMVVGAFGVRHSTLERVGDFSIIDPCDGIFHDLTHAGLFGKETSHSVMIPGAPVFTYRGHVVRNGVKVCMQDFKESLLENLPPSNNSLSLPIGGILRCPTILILGTSMSCGKTYTGRLIINTLKDMGVAKVLGMKLTGAGCYSDILSYKDAGADQIIDFVDIGIPSSVVDTETYRRSLKALLTVVSAANPDVVVAEAGGSPCEGYNGQIVVEEIAKHVDLIVLCASNPYGAQGFIQTYGVIPDIISGIVTSTTAGCDLVEKLIGIQPLNMADKGSIRKLRSILAATISGEDEHLE